MKTSKTICGLVMAAGVALALLAPPGSLAATGGNGIIMNETFDEPTLQLFGWDDGVTDISREYVDGGVQRSTAVQISGNFTEPWAYLGTMLVQNGTVMNNGRSTVQSCRLSLDIKVDRPGLKYIQIGVQSWEGYIWFGEAYSSIGYIPLGTYAPGKFQTLVVPLDDPLWELDEYSTIPLAGEFDPQGKTWQIFISLDGGALQELGPVTVTVDNLKVITKQPLVPYQGRARGTVAYDPGTQTIALNETGIAEHIGNFTSTCVIGLLQVFPDGGMLWGGPVTTTTSNGDKFFGTLYTFDFYSSIISIEGGTGRFNGAVGSFVANVTFDDATMSSYTGKSAGSISTVGSNK